MSVLVSKRKESKHEAIVFSVELHNMLIEFAQRNFGIKDPERMLREKYSRGDTDPMYLLAEHKRQIHHLASLLEADLRAAKSLYPTTLHEYEIRRDYQNFGIVNCNQLINQLQRIIDVFDVDLNVYERYIKAIDREIELIKRWRQRDNKIKKYVSQQKG